MVQAPGAAGTAGTIPGAFSEGEGELLRRGLGVACLEKPRLRQSCEDSCLQESGWTSEREKERYQTIASTGPASEGPSSSNMCSIIMTVSRGLCVPGVSRPLSTCNNRENPSMHA